MIERGLVGRESLNDDTILDTAPAETLEELNSISRRYFAKLS